MERKEHYRINLPHFQQPGQTYFVTWMLKNAVSYKALPKYADKISSLRYEIKVAKNAQLATDKIETIKKEYYITRKKYIQAFDDLMDSQTVTGINLSRKENTDALMNTLHFYNGKKIYNYAFCIMPNHVHWVFETLKVDENGKPVYLQDIMQSVKRFSANKINEIENRKGSLWQKESFETTIRNNRHLYNTIEYTINNPVKAGLVENVNDWYGTWYEK